MSRTSLYQFVTSLLLTVLSIRAVQYVIVPDVYTTVEEDTVIKCHIMFTEKVLSSKGKITFEMVGTSLRCDITDWHTCPAVYVDVDHRPANFSCGCLSQVHETFYTLYLYLQSCPIEMDNTRYRCIPAFAEDKQTDGQLRLIDFCKKPASQILKCEGESVHFHWEYNPNDYESHLPISHISWLFYPTKGQPVFIGTFENDAVHSKDRDHFGHRASIRTVPLKETIAFLVVLSLQRGDSGTFQIEIVFLSRASLPSYTDDELPSFLNETFSAPTDFNVQDGLSYDYGSYVNPKPPTEDRIRSERMLPGNEANDDDEPWQAADYANHTSRLPLLLSDFIEKVKPTLRSSSTLRIVEPVRENLEIVFKKMRRSSDVFLYCSVLAFSSSTSFSYISFVIKHSDTVLAISHRQSFLLFKLDVSSPMDNYSCELTGKAVQCVNKTLPQMRKLRMEIDNLLSDEIVPPVVEKDFTFLDVMYLLEGITCLALMFWNCVLMAKHVGYLCSMKVRREKEKLQAAESLVLERKSARQSVKQRRRKVTLVLPPSDSGVNSPAAITSDASSRNDTLGLYSDDVSTDWEVSVSSRHDETDNS